MNKRNLLLALLAAGVLIGVTAAAVGAQNATKAVPGAGAEGASEPAGGAAEADAPDPAGAADAGPNVDHQFQGEEDHQD